MSCKLYVHLFKNVNLNSNDENENEPKEVRPRCLFCAKDYLHINTLKIHVNEKHMKKPLKEMITDLVYKFKALSLEPYNSKKKKEQRIRQKNWRENVLKLKSERKIQENENDNGRKRKF